MAAKMTTGIVQEHNNNNNIEKQIEKQMGCMAGFLQIFDRSQILAGKRPYSTKRLPSSSPTVAVSEPSSTASPETPTELPRQNKSAPSPDRLNSKQSPSPSELRSPLPELNTPTSQSSSSPCPPKSPSTWKFSRDMPRLSLDSRATVDAKGSLHPKHTPTNAALLSDNINHRSPSVIARLMGLEPLSQSDSPDPIKLRRSASESRVNKEFYHPARSSVDNPNPNPNARQQAEFKTNTAERSNGSSRQVDRKSSYNAKSQMVQQRKKSFYDSGDFFPPEPNKQSVYGEIEKRLRMRGIDDQSNDLETLKQILEALQLKGLLHSSRKTSPQTNNNPRNLVFGADQSPTVVMRPSRSPIRPARFGNDSPPSSFRSKSAGTRRNSNPGTWETYQAVSPRRGRPENVRNQSPPRRSESGVRSPSRRGPLVVDTQKRGSSDQVEHRRVSPVHSPKVTPRRSVSDQQSPRVKKPTVEIKRKEGRVTLHRAEDDSPTMSESSMSNSTSSQTDTEKWNNNNKVEEYKEGRSLLERCDKLLNSIAELQPSPVSVLDSSFYKEEESSPSPVMKRSIDFKGEMEDLWGQAICLNESSESDDPDFVYVSEILRGLNYLPYDVDVFLFLEKQKELKGKDTFSPASTLERRLIFDVINEILNRNRLLPPWKAVSMHTSLPETWSEFKRIREREESEDLFEVICGVLKKDLVGDAINGWGDCSVEFSEAVLDIERLVFKDLIGETIQELAVFSPNSGRVAALCRKLVF